LKYFYGVEAQQFIRPAVCTYKYSFCNYWNSSIAYEPFAFICIIL